MTCGNAYMHRAWAYRLPKHAIYLYSNDPRSSVGPSSTEDGGCPSAAPQGSRTRLVREAGENLLIDLAGELEPFQSLPRRRPFGVAWIPEYPCVNGELVRSPTGFFQGVIQTGALASQLALPSYARSGRVKR